MKRPFLAWILTRIGATCIARRDGADLRSQGARPFLGLRSSDGAQSAMEGSVKWWASRGPNPCSERPTLPREFRATLPPSRQPSEDPLSRTLPPSLSWLQDPGAWAQGFTSRTWADRRRSTTPRCVATPPQCGAWFMAARRSARRTPRAGPPCTSALAAPGGSCPPYMSTLAATRPSPPCCAVIVFGSSADRKWRNAAVRLGAGQIWLGFGRIAAEFRQPIWAQFGPSSTSVGRIRHIWTDLDQIQADRDHL